MVKGLIHGKGSPTILTGNRQHSIWPSTDCVMDRLGTFHYVCVKC